MHCTALQATLHPCTLHPAPCTLQPLTALQPLGSPSFIPLTWYRCFIFNPSQANGLYAGNIAMSSCCSLQLSDPRLPFFYCARHSMSQAIMYYVKRLTMSTPLILQSGWIYTMTRQHSAPLHAQAGRSRQHACRPRALPPRQPTCHQDSTPSSILSSHAPGEIGKAGIRNSTIRMQKKNISYRNSSAVSYKTKQHMAVAWICNEMQTLACGQDGSSFTYYVPLPSVNISKMGNTNSGRRGNSQLVLYISRGTSWF